MGCAPAREWRQRGQRSSVQQAGLEKQEDASDSRGVLVGSQEAHLRDWPRNPNRRSSTCWVVRIALLGKPPSLGGCKKNPRRRVLRYPGLLHMAMYSTADTSARLARAIQTNDRNQFNGPAWNMEAPVSSRTVGRETQARPVRWVEPISVALHEPRITSIAASCSIVRKRARLPEPTPTRPRPRPLLISLLLPICPPSIPLHPPPAPYTHCFV
jgi:hypothetical protein